MNTCKWLSYSFTVNTIDAEWSDKPGVYVFCGVNRSGEWVAYYVGKTDSFRDRMTSHERWPDAQFLGATHVHARVIRDEDERSRVEEELIQTLQPRMNTAFR